MSENNQTQRSGAFRKKRVYFSQVSNVALRDNNLTLKAKGLYSLIQSYITIEDFTLYKTTLKKQCIEGEKAFESTWKELKDAGYLIQYRFQDKTEDENGKVSNHFYYEYELLEVPDKDLANKTHASQNRKKKEEKVHTPKMVGMGKKQHKAHTPKTDDMDNGSNGSGGGYNNIDPNNTYLTNTEDDDNKKESIIINEDQIETFVKGFNEVSTKKVHVVTRNRKEKLQELINKLGFETIIQVLPKIKQSTWAKDNLEFNYLIDTEENFCNTLNGKYDDRVNTSNSNGELKSKNPHFTNTHSHNWDFDQLDRMADEYLERQINGMDN